MNCLVISDSHGHSGALRDVIASVGKAGLPDRFLFLGDGLRDLEYLSEPSVTPFLAVRGNCDFFLADDVPLSRVVPLGKYRAVMMHGHSFGVKSGIDRAAAFAAQNSADILLYGHTHIPHCETIPKGERVGGETLEKDLYILNPGALCEGSFGTLTLKENGILLSHGSLW